MSRLRLRRLAAASLAATALFAVSACSSSGEESAGGDETMKIGVLQFVQHPALDAATEGFKEALDDAGV
ncbi:MAG: sugar ABC transporter substrate-binding protein, partial [Microbacterium gubbeenense]